MGGRGHAIAKMQNIMPTPVFLIRTNGAVGVWWFGVKYAVMEGIDLWCWITMPKAFWTRCSNLRSCLSSKVMGCYFSRATHFLSQSTSHRVFWDQTQSVYCPGLHSNPYRTPSSPRAGPHWSSDEVKWPIFRKRGAVVPGNLGGLRLPLMGKGYSRQCHGDAE